MAAEALARGRTRLDVCATHDARVIGCRRAETSGWSGAMGVPMVETAAQAQQIASWCRYRPQGMRGGRVRHAPRRFTAVAIWCKSCPKPTNARSSTSWSCCATSWARWWFASERPVMLRSGKLLKVVEPISSQTRPSA
jgi:hypothetical protein